MLQKYYWFTTIQLHTLFSIWWFDSSLALLCPDKHVKRRPRPQDYRSSLPAESSNPWPDLSKILAKKKLLLLLSLFLSQSPWNCTWVPSAAVLVLGLCHLLLGLSSLNRLFVFMQHRRRDEWHSSALKTIVQKVLHCQKTNKKVAFFLRAKRVCVLTRFFCLHWEKKSLRS